MFFERNPFDKIGIAGLYRNPVITKKSVTNTSEPAFTQYMEEGTISTETNPAEKTVTMKYRKSRKRPAPPKRSLVHGKRPKLTVRRTKKKKKKTKKIGQKKVYKKRRKVKDRF